MKLKTKLLAVVLSGAMLFPMSNSEAQSGPSLVILVRHAEKAAVPGSDPPLSDAGKARAAALAKALGDTKVSTIVVSTYQRTAETAADVAREHELTPIKIGLEGGIAAHVSKVADAVRASSGVVLVVGHNNTVPMVAAALGAPRLSDICEEHYGYMLLVQPAASGSASLTVATYGAPNGTDTSCTSLNKR